MGLIPARAGNTKVTVKPDSEDRAHPRSRGEHETGNYETGYEWGSSPLARGTHKFAPIYLMLIGLIPARAGTTLLVKSLS